MIPLCRAGGRGRGAGTSWKLVLLRNLTGRVVIYRSMGDSTSRATSTGSCGTSSTIETAVFTIDPVHSTVGFSVRHLMITNVHGEFTKFKAAVQFDPENLEDCAVEASIQADSIDTGNAKRDEHLRSSDFFDAAHHPRLSYRSRRFYRDDQENLLIEGELTMRGATRPIILLVEGPTRPVKDPWGVERIGLVARGRVNRHDFGIDWNQRLEGGGVMIGREVELTLDLSLVRKE